MTSRSALTAVPWRKIEGILPGNAGDRGRTAADHRPFVPGVRWVLRSGAHWRHWPARYGHWKSMHKRCTRWAKAGIGERILALLMQAPRTHTCCATRRSSARLSKRRQGKGASARGVGAFPRRIDDDKPHGNGRRRPPGALSAHGRAGTRGHAGPSVGARMEAVAGDGRPGG